jgi:hypothetical protein
MVKPVFRRKSIGRVARALILNFRVPHLSRSLTGGVFDFDSS